MNPSLFTPYVSTFLDELPQSPFDIQARLGELALQMSLAWMCGDTYRSVAAAADSEWKAMRDALGYALSDAQRAVGRRVKIGTLWVS